MLNFMKWVFLVAAVTVLTGCGEPTLDTSSEEAMGQSAKEIMAELSEEEQARFKEAIAGIYMMGAFAMMGGDVSEKELEAEINAKLDGKTADDIFEMVDDLQKEMNQ